MKRTIVLFGLLVCFAMGIYAQSIIGTWCSQSLSDDDEMETRLEFTFNKDKTLLLNMNITASTPNFMEMKCHFAINGTYDNMVGDVLPFKLSKDNIKCVIDKMELKGDMAKMSNPENMKKMIQQQFEENKEEMTEDFPEEGRFIISNLTNNNMTLKMDDDVLYMTKVK